MNKNTTHQNQTDVINTVLQLLLDHHQDALAEGFRLLVNEAMKAERDYALNADPYERTPPKAPHHHALERLNQELKPEPAWPAFFRLNPLWSASSWRSSWNKANKGNPTKPTSPSKTKTHPPKPVKAIYRKLVAQPFCCNATLLSSLAEFLPGLSFRANEM